MLEFLRSSIRSMAGYVPGEQFNDPNILKLNTNENSYPPSPLVFDAVRSALHSNTLRKYPQPLGDTFRKAAGEVLKVDPDGILIGNGSDDILTILTRAFVPDGGLIASLNPSYLLYKSLAEIQGARYTTVRFNEDWSIPDPWPVNDANLTFLPSPNSPSGTTVSHPQILKLATNGPLILDEAYADFAETNGLSLLKQSPMIAITRTMSKYYSLAGIRFGFAIASPAVVRELIKVKDSYNCDALSLAAATAAIRDQDYYADIRARILQTRGRLSSAMAELGFLVTQSQANFVWCRRTDQPVKPIAEKLKARKILVRYMSYPDYGDGLRITVGTPQEIEHLIAEMKTIV